MMSKTGIVMSADNKKVFIMTSTGEFFNVKLHGSTPEIGSEYTGELVNKKPSLLNLRHAAAAAAIALVLLAGGGAYAYNIPISTITVSSNPEVQIKANIFNRVIGVTSPDKNIADNLNLKNSSVDDAVLNVVKTLDNKKTEKENSAPVSIEIKGKDIDTTNIKKNLDNKNINYTIKNSNAKKTNDSGSVNSNNKKENNSEKKDKILNNKKE